MDYDAFDRELDIEFSAKVTYGKVKVTVKDAKGKSYRAKILEKDSDGMEVRVKDLKRDKDYTVTVSGIAPRNGQFVTVSGSFTAR